MKKTNGEILFDNMLVLVYDNEGMVMILVHEGYWNE